MRAKQVEFAAPPGTVPEGTEAGEEFDLVCTFQTKDGGTVCLTKMGDTPMPGYGDGERRHRGGMQAAPSYGEYIKGVQNAGEQAA